MKEITKFRAAAKKKEKITSRTSKGARNNIQGYLMMGYSTIVGSSVRKQKRNNILGIIFKLIQRNREIKPI